MLRKQPIVTILLIPLVKLYLYVKLSHIINSTIMSKIHISPWCYLLLKKQSFRKIIQKIRFFYYIEKQGSLELWLLQIIADLGRSSMRKLLFVLNINWWFFFSWLTNQQNIHIKVLKFQAFFKTSQQWHLSKWIFVSILIKIDTISSTSSFTSNVPLTTINNSSSSQQSIKLNNINNILGDGADSEGAKTLDTDNFGELIEPLPSNPISCMPGALHLSTSSTDLLNTNGINSSNNTSQSQQQGQINLNSSFSVVSSPAPQSATSMSL